MWVNRCCDVMAVLSRAPAGPVMGPALAWGYLSGGPSGTADRRPAGGGGGPERAGPTAVGAVSDRARHRRGPVRVHPRPARGEARPPGRARRLTVAPGPRRVRLY